MRIGIPLSLDYGLDSEVCAHFGQCAYFLIVDVDKDGKISSHKVVVNNTTHGGGGCQAVGELLSHDITHVIAGGMGMGAQQKFANAGVQISGFSGKAKDGISKLLESALGGIDACREHGGACS